MRRRWRTRTAAAVLGFALLTTAGCSGGGSGTGGAAAVVEGVKISAPETEALTDAYLDSKTQAGEEAQPREQVAKLVLQYQIKLTYLEHLAEKMKADDVPESVFSDAADAIEAERYQQVGMRKEDFARELRANRLYKALARKVFPVVPVSESALREEYERRAPVLERNWRLTAEVARFTQQQEAAKASAEVQGGKSLEESARDLGADRFDTVEIDPLANAFSLDVLDVIGGLAPGQVSAPLQVGQSWLVVLAKAREELPEATFELVRAELEEIVTDRQRLLKFNKWFEEKFTKAAVKVDGRYGKWDAKVAGVT